MRRKKQLCDPIFIERRLKAVFGDDTTLNTVNAEPTEEFITILQQSSPAERVALELNDPDGIGQLILTLNIVQGIFDENLIFYVPEQKQWYVTEFAKDILKDEWKIY